MMEARFIDGPNGLVIDGDVPDRKLGAAAELEGGKRFGLGIEAIEAIEAIEPEIAIVIGEDGHDVGLFGAAEGAALEGGVVGKGALLGVKMAEDVVATKPEGVVWGLVDSFDGAVGEAVRVADIVRVAGELKLLLVEDVDAILAGADPEGVVLAGEEGVDVIGAEGVGPSGVMGEGADKLFLLVVEEEEFASF